MTKSINDMTARELEAFLRQHGASRSVAKAMTADLMSSQSETRNPFDEPETSTAIAEMLAAVTKEKSR